MKDLTPYQQELVKYNHHCEQKWKNGGVPSLPAGLSDVFRVFMKHGARSNIEIISRLERNHEISTFLRGSRRKNFDAVAMWIVANVEKVNGTFAKQGTQQQIAERLGISQPTVSRILELMCKMRVIKPIFPNQEDPSSGSAAVVGDKGESLLIRSMK
ncbi:winged helix-turn-helix transcriptional regulator [Vibrio hannami]|uniref:winged helix-turn-helix transcriptional regulator n=1 Tax=Vibrio hannami TaxID=2717094 RepID=UPI00240EAEAC|nr:winged helix-turn-helix transcriptional regulator [Vibrio hannami]MDG3088126.1 winged helix-turn-helix transcriptional regulator [Vibrio hannami]